MSPKEIYHKFNAMCPLSPETVVSYESRGPNKILIHTKRHGDFMYEYTNDNKFKFYHI